MILNHDQILRLLHTNVVEGADPEQVNGTSLDLTLDRTILIERPRSYSVGEPISLRDRAPLDMAPIDMTNNIGCSNPARHPHDESGRCLPGYILRPGEFILAATRERFNLPLHLSAEYKLKSSMARVGLNHLNAGWCDPGWHGSALTLELVNTTQHHPILLQPGDRIGQLVFFPSDPVEEGRSYVARGAYNNDRGVRGAKAPRR